MNAHELYQNSQQESSAPKTHVKKRVQKAHEKQIYDIETLKPGDFEGKRLCTGIDTQATSPSSGHPDPLSLASQYASTLPSSTYAGLNPSEINGS